MDLEETVGDRKRLVRTLLAVGLTGVAIRSLRRGRRLNGLLAGAGAAVLGYTATSQSEELAETVGIGTTNEDVGLRCAACGEPIVPGQARGPNENGETVHDACRESAE